MNAWLGWHFNVNNRLANGDRRRIRVGTTHRVKGPPVLCSRGLHASARALDALGYAPLNATHVARVRLSGERLDGEDKSAATERTYIAVIPVRPVLDEFACRCAEATLMIADVEDERSWRPIHLKREWLSGRATDAELAAARDAAWTAARDAAWAAARAAARDAARVAAWDAAWAAAWAAARDDASAAAWDEINDLLESMLLEAMGLTR